MYNVYYTLYMYGTGTLHVDDNKGRFSTSNFKTFPAPQHKIFWLQNFTIPGKLNY